ncbi:MAG: hypothetical protein V1685_05910 [Parcubacteria group bacterium]
MNKSDVEAAIEARLSERKKSVLNRNAIGALFGAFADPVGALGHVFLGRGDAIDHEKQRIAQDVILELLCKIDESLSQANAKSEQHGIKLGGLIETIAHGGESLTGLNIGANSGPVTLQPGIHVRTVATGVRNVTGVKIGGTEE